VNVVATKNGLSINLKPQEAVKLGRILAANKLYPLLTSSLLRMLRMEYKEGKGELWPGY